MKMKVRNTLALIALAAAVALPHTAQAGDKERALIGGLIGGIIIGKALDNGHRDHHVSVSYRSTSYCGGYWEWRTVRSWVPGYYERSCDRYGRTRKVWVTGHYDYRKERVWVSSSRHEHGPSCGCSDHGSHDRYSSRSRSSYERYDHDDRYDRYDGRYSHGTRQAANRF